MFYDADKGAVGEVASRASAHREAGGLAHIHPSRVKLEAQELWVSQGQRLKRNEAPYL
jgi:hypothetical protein